MNQTITPNLLNNITSFVLNSSNTSLPKNSKFIMKLSLLDWITVLICGRDEKVSSILRNIAINEGGKTESTVFGLERKFPARLAALVNGTTSHALDYDDTHFCYVGHPSTVIIPASLAIAEKIGSNFDEFLNACLIGAETSCRIGGWIGMNHYKFGFHNTATIGIFGATLSCCRLLNLNQKQTIYAIGIAASKASGLKSQFGTMGKPYHAGMAASNAVESAFLAKEGFVSSPYSFAGEQSFAKTHLGQFNNIFIDDLGKSFIFDDVLHKYHACCHGLHATIESLKKIIKNNQNINKNQIKKINVFINPKWLKVCNILTPKTGLEIKFSFRMICSLVFFGYDTAALDTYSDKLCKEKKLVLIRDKVFVNEDLELNDTSSKVEVVLENQKIYSNEFDISINPSNKKRHQNLMSKTSSLLGENQALSLWEFIENEIALPTRWIESYFINKNT